MARLAARSHELAQLHSVQRPPRAWLAAVLSLLLAGLGHLYVWRPRLALTLWMTSVVVGAMSVWAWSEPRSIALQCAVFAITVIVSLAIAWHAWRIARTSSSARRPSSARLVAILVCAYTIAAILGSLTQRWIKHNIVEPYRLPSASMEPALLSGDWVMVSRKRAPLRRDELIAFSRNGDTLLKRIAGLPGDTLLMRKGDLLRNGTQVNVPSAITVGADYTGEEFAWQTPYLVPGVDARRYKPSTDDWGPLIVPPEKIFVLGDNRHNSMDSRFYGFISTDSVNGRPTEVYFSWDPIDHAVRWNRIGHRLDH